MFLYKVRKGVLQIPRQIIDTILLRKIDSGELYQVYTYTCICCTQLKYCSSSKFISAVCYSHKLSSDITDSDEESDVADCSRDNGVDSALLQNVLAGT